MKRPLCSHVLARPEKLLVPVAIFFALFALSSCQCDSPLKESEQVDETPPPLEEVGVPSEIEAEIYPDVGSTAPEPVVLVLSRSSEFCGAARDTYRDRAHVLCRVGRGRVEAYAEDEAALMRALAFFKRKYAPYFEGRPAHLITDAAYAPLGWKMLLADPAVFGHAYLPGLSEDLVDQTTLYALHSKGAEQLIVDLPWSKRMELFAQVARRGGLDLSHVAPGPDGLKEALQLLVQSDKRFAVPALKP